MDQNAKIIEVEKNEILLQTNDLQVSNNSLPADPVVFIEAGHFWKPIKLREFWQYRELLYFLVWRDVKIRYKQTLLGVAWAILQPILATVIFTIIFGRFAGIPSDGIPYALFAFAGFLPWTFFSNAVTTSGNSLVGSAHLITKVYFPRLIIPIASVLAGLVDFFIAFGILVLMMIWYGVGLTQNIFMLLPIILLTFLIASSVGILMSALNVKYRDIRFALPFLIQIWMFATPIVYPSSMIPEKWRFLMAFNPMAGVIEGYRSTLLGREFDWLLLGISFLITIIIFVFAIVLFRHMEKEFADII